MDEDNFYVFLASINYRSLRISCAIKSFDISFSIFKHFILHHLCRHGTWKPEKFRLKYISRLQSRGASRLFLTNWTWAKHPKFWRKLFWSFAPNWKIRHMMCVLWHSSRHDVEMLLKYFFFLSLHEMKNCKNQYFHFKVTQTREFTLCGWLQKHAPNVYAIANLQNGNRNYFYFSTTSAYLNVVIERRSRIHENMIYSTLMAEFSQWKMCKKIYDEGNNFYRFWMKQQSFLV